MSHNLAKINWEDQVRFLILRYPHDMLKVAESASALMNTTVTVEEVNRIKQRMKRTLDRDIAARVAANLAQHIIQGSMERCAKLEAMFQMWDGKDVAVESLCCSAPAIEHPGAFGTTGYYTCAKCETNCGTRIIRDETLQKLKIKLLQEMRAESEHLIAFAKQMGFTSTQDGPTQVVNNKNQFLIVGQQQNTQMSGPVQIDSRMAKKVDEMSPVEREHLIQDLQKMAETATEAISGSSSEDPKIPEEPAQPST